MSASDLVGHLAADIAAELVRETAADAERYRRIRYCRKFVGMLEFQTAHVDTDEQYDAAVDALPRPRGAS